MNSSSSTDPGDSRRRSLIGGLDGVAGYIPGSVLSAILIFGNLGPDMLAAGICATLLSLAWMHFSMARDQRPVVYSARIFEAATLASMMERSVSQFGGWNLPDTPGTRLALLCMIGTASALCLGLLYLARAERFTRFIPGPVFVGFSNSIGLLLLLSQTKSLWQLLTGQDPVLATILFAAGAIAIGVAIRQWRPRLPATAIALAVGTVAGAILLATGTAIHTVSSMAWSFVLPVSQADFGALWAPDVQLRAIAGTVATDAAILGIIMFINNSFTAQFMTRFDERRRTRLRPTVIEVAGITLAGVIGSCPISASAQYSASAARTAPISARTMLVCSVLTLAVLLSGVLAWLPVAVLSAAILVDAVQMFDRRSISQLWSWLRRRPLLPSAREDVALMVAVTVTALLINMVASIFVGLLLGLVLFASRNAAKPVRYVWTGGEISSNCARSRADLRILAANGNAIRIFELEGDLFFGACDSLDRSLRAGMKGLECAVIDWSRVSRVDSSIAETIAKLERHAMAGGTLVVHAGSDMRQGNVAPELLAHIPDAVFAADLDRALELAENQVLHRRTNDSDPQALTGLQEAVALHRGLDDRERAVMTQAMGQVLYRAGEALVTTGDPSDTLLLVLHGSASVVVRSPEGKDIRLAGVRRGATIGEIGFLDGAPRSATVVAQEDISVAVLTRAQYEQLCVTEPELVRKLLSNIALDVATRLRHTNRLAMARQGRG